MEETKFKLPLDTVVESKFNELWTLYSYKYGGLWLQGRLSAAHPADGSWGKVVKLGPGWKVDCGDYDTFCRVWVALGKTALELNTNRRFIWGGDNGDYAWGSNESMFNKHIYPELPLSLVMEVTGLGPGTTAIPTPPTTAGELPCTCSGMELHSGQWAPQCQYHRGREAVWVGRKGLGMQVTPRTDPELFTKQEIRDWWKDN
jgi:hypothetical protein